MNIGDFKIPGIANGQVVPPGTQLQQMKDEARERRDTRRFIVTTIIGAVAAVASVVAATASVIACLS